jgi:CHAD domain-containing protein
MAYRFKLNERIGKALQRTGREQIDAALGHLEASRSATAVHGARKCIKRLRALLRLARPGLAKSAYTELNTILRDAGRTLSTTRDRDVLLATIAELSVQAPQLRPALRQLSAALAHQAAQEPPAGKASPVTAAREQMELARERWRRLKLEQDAFEPLFEGLARGMRELAAAFDASDNGDEEAFHDLRKAIQRHWRHMRLIEAGWPAYFSTRAEEAKAIADILGRAQDLTLLLRHLRDGGPHKPSPEHLVAIEVLVRQQREALQQSARTRTRRLLADGPSALARRALEYWAAARMLEAAPPLPHELPTDDGQRAKPAAARPARRRSARAAAKASSPPAHAAAPTMSKPRA